MASNQSKREPAKNQIKTDSVEHTARVLYQKMAGKWYAFSVVEDEVYLGAVPEELVPGVDAGLSDIE